MNSLTSLALHLTRYSVVFEEDFKKIMWCRSDKEHKGIYTLLHQSELQKTRHYEGKPAHASSDFTWIQMSREEPDRQVTPIIRSFF